MEATDGPKSRVTYRDIRAIRGFPFSRVWSRLIMKSSFGLGLYIALLAISSAGLAQENRPKAATPEKEHEWLAQLAGEFTTDAEAVFSARTAAV